MKLSTEQALTILSAMCPSNIQAGGPGEIVFTIGPGLFITLTPSGKWLMTALVGS